MRRKLSGKTAAKVFRKGDRTNVKNISARPMRGGIRA